MPSIIIISQRVRALLRRIKHDPNLRIFGTDKLIDDLGFTAGGVRGLTVPLREEFADELTAAGKTVLVKEVQDCELVDDLTVLIWEKT